MDKNLEVFKENNPSIEIIEDNEHINIKNPWSDNSFILQYSKDLDFSILTDIELPNELCAIFHKSSQILEFIYAPLLETLDYLSRRTIFLYKGIEFKTEFKESSKQLTFISKGFKEIDFPNESYYRNLGQFREYYSSEQQQMNNLFYSDKKPFSFFVSGDFKNIKNELIPFCMHLNFYMRYFDRDTPTIRIINTDFNVENYNIPCKTNIDQYPSIITANVIDQVALDLLQVASDAGDTRLRYLFYYQVLEYFAYYYLDEEVKRRLANLLKNPDILNNYNNYSKIIIEELKDYTTNTTDKQKFNKLIANYLTVEDIKDEVKCNLKYFTNDIEFDGHFVLPALINDEKIFDKIFIETKETKEKRKEIERLRQELVNSIADRIERIRNVLVHIRESRESKVIYPTKNNNQKLLPYLYLVRRVSEIIALKYNV
jgi:hypothetical protein